MPKRSNAKPSARAFAVPVLATLIVACLAFTMSQRVRAVGEPTLDITMDKYAFGPSDTALVTFTFSAFPLAFDNTDVDLTAANGVLSTVKPSPDPRVWLATFTPNPGVDSDFNNVIVGTAWTDPGGVGPLAPTKSPNYTIHTTMVAGHCPTPSVKIASPSGGEILAAGAQKDVFWTVAGCDFTALDLSLSMDGGASYPVHVGTVDDPVSGVFHWTVPDLGTSAGRLRAMLLGQGGVVLASDETPGTFTVTPSSTSSSGGGAPTPPPPPSGGGGTPTPPTPPPSGGSGGTATPPSGGGGGTTSPSVNAPPATTTKADKVTPASPGKITVAPPPPTPPPVAKTAPQPMAPPMPNIPVPLSAQPSNETAMPNAADNQTAALDAARGATETAATYAPSSLELSFSFVLGALTMLGLLLGGQQVLRSRRNKGTRPCRRCRGTGREAAEQKGPEVCDQCGGTGTVEEEEEESAECPHCKGEGEDPCHVCKGSGKDAAGGECKACRGGGVTLEDPEEEDSEAKECEVCRGEGEVSTTVKKPATCDKCGGTGKL